MKTNKEANLDRCDFLEKNKAALVCRIRESGIDSPVGVVADLRDFHGRQFAIAMGMNESGIDQEIARYRREKKIPTLTAVITWKEAEALMPHTSPTANTTLARAKTVCTSTRHALLIAIMSRGNRYEVIDLSNTDVDAATTDHTDKEGQ